MAKRERSKTRADMIAMLKSRGVRGRLSKMTKAQLRTKLDETAPPPEDQEGDGRKPQRSGELELEADRKGKIVAPVSQAESSCLKFNFVRILVGGHPRNAHFRIAT